MPIVIRALDLVGQHGSPVEMRAIYTGALYEAAKHNSSDIMKLLLDSGTQFGRAGLSNAFDVACDSGHSRAVLCLIENGTRNFFGPQECSRGLEKAAMKGHSEIVRCCIERCSRQSHLAISEEAVTTASGNRSAEIVRLLVEKLKSSKSRHGILDRALNIASQNCHTEVAEFLIREGGDVNAVVEEVSAPRGGRDSYPYFRTIEGPGRQSNALQAAVRGSSSELSHYGPPILGSGWRRGDTTAQEATIHLLLEKGADVNELAGCPTYPLYAAAAQCSERVVQSIADKGAVLGASTSEDETALKAASGRELRAATIMKLLFQAGAVVPESDAGRNPVLNSALTFFGKGQRWPHSSGSFLQLNSVIDVLEDGPGAVVKMLLPRLPMEKADNK